MSELPQRDEIFQCEDMDQLHCWHEEALIAQKQIIADLEFSNKHDESWNYRARKALAFHDVCLSHLNKRIHQLLKKNGDEHTERNLQKKTVKLQEKEVKIANQQISLARSSNKLERDHIALVNRKIDAIMRVQWHKEFIKAAKAVLDQNLYQQIMDLADKYHEDVIKREFK